MKKVYQILLLSFIMICPLAQLKAQRIVEIVTTSPTDSIFIENEFCGIGGCRVNVLGGDGIRRIRVKNRVGAEKQYPQLIESGDSVISRKLYSQLEYNWSGDATPEQREVIKNIADRMVPIRGGRMVRSRDMNMGVMCDFMEDFYLDAYNISQKEWQIIMGDNPSIYKGDDRPVESISYNDAMLFVEKINRISGLKFDLPNDAQYEYAAYNGEIGNSRKNDFRITDGYKYEEGPQHVTCYGPTKLGLYGIGTNRMLDWTHTVNLYVKDGQYGTGRYAFVDEKAGYGILRGCTSYGSNIGNYAKNKDIYLKGLSGIRLAHSTAKKSLKITAELQNKEIAPRKPNYKNLFKEENPRQDLLDEAAKYIEGKDGYIESPHKAEKLYKKAAKEGCIEAYYYLGMLYKSPLLGEPDKEKAFEYFSESAGKGHSQSLYEIGYILYENNLYKEAEEILTLAGESGHSDAITMLATMNYHGEGVAIDRYAAMALFYRAAELRNKYAEFNLASGYASSHKGITYDPKCIEKHLKSSAEMGYNEAINSYGKYLYDQKRYEECIEWLERGDEMGIANSQYLLASCYKEGKGVDVDMESYLHYLQRAAANNHRKAKEELNEF